MAIATATALAIGLGASAASSVAAAKIQSNAAKEAAKIQTAAAERATALQKEQTDKALATQNAVMFGNQGQGGSGGGLPGGITGLYAPYTQTGPASLAALHEYLGIPGSAQGTTVPQGAYQNQQTAFNRPPGGFIPAPMNPPTGFPAPGAPTPAPMFQRRQLVTPSTLAGVYRPQG